jgi:hypothetical protein
MARKGRIHEYKKCAWKKCEQILWSKLNLNTHKHTQYIKSVTSKKKKKTYKSLEMSLVGTKSREWRAQHIQQTARTVQTRQEMYARRKIEARSYKHCCLEKQ